MSLDEREDPKAEPACAERQVTSRYSVGSDQFLAAFLVAALLVGLLRRLWMGWDSPLWLDEAFTGAIAIQPTVAGLWRDCVHELGGPLYYSLVWAWARVFGVSDIALRAPSLLFAVATPLLILWKGHANRRIRFTWAAIAALWLPGFYYTTEARAYSLLFLLGSVQVIALARLVASNGRRDACIWAGVSTLLILTHTHTALLTAVQGLMYLAVHRSKALGHWPAALLLLPAAAWTLFRLPLLIRFSDPKVAWQPLLTPEHLYELPRFLFGMGPIGLPLAILVFGISLWAVLKAAIGARKFGYGVDDMVPVLASIVAVTIVVAVGFISPSYTDRYMVPIIPGFLLGVSLWANGWGPRSPFPAALIIICLLMALTEMIIQLRYPKLDFKRGYSWEEASHYLRGNGVQRTIFVLDNPTVRIADRDQLARVGAFFLHRDGVMVASDAVTIATGSDDDFRRAIFAAASTGEARRQTIGAITVGRRLDLSGPDSSWTCRDFGGAEKVYAVEVYITACLRPPTGADRVSSRRPAVPASLR